MIEHLGRGIYFSGALNPQDWQRAHEEPLIDQFETIYKYRQKLLHLFEMDIEPFNMRVNILGTLPNTTSE
jgi:hypothetical protein